MDTLKAKKIAIIALAVLNLALFACSLVFLDYGRYRITPTAEANITEVLRRGGITFTSAHGAFPREFAPMPQLWMQGFIYDTVWLRSVFFSGGADVEESTEDTRIIYRQGARSLSVNTATGFVVFRDRDVGEGLPDLDAATTAAEALVARISAVYPGFALDIPPYETPSGLVFEYRQEYRGYTLYSNYIHITAGPGGISRAEFMCAVPLGFDTQLRSITPPDEALISFMHEIRNVYGDIPVTIEQIDIVYNQSVSAAEEEQAAWPYYRVRLAGYPEAILVNAYTNNVVSRF